MSARLLARSSCPLELTLKRLIREEIKGHGGTQSEKGKGTKRESFGIHETASEVIRAQPRSPPYSLTIFSSSLDVYLHLLNMLELRRRDYYYSFSDRNLRCCRRQVGWGLVITFVLSFFLAVFDPECQ